jgi:hypothetical protein
MNAMISVQDPALGGGPPNLALAGVSTKCWNLPVGLGTDAVTILSLDWTEVEMMCSLSIP